MGDKRQPGLAGQTELMPLLERGSQEEVCKFARLAENGIDLVFR